MAAPTYVATGTFSHGSGSLSPGLPTGWAQDDIFLLVVHARGSSISIAAPSGWTNLTGSPAAHGFALETIAVMWKRAGSSESAPSVADPGGTYAGARISAFRGCPTSGNPWDVAGSHVGHDFASSLSISGVTTTVASTLIAVHVGVFDDVSFSGWSNGNLTSVTERMDGSAGANFISIGMATGVKATASATGSTSLSISTSSYPVGHTVALKGVDAGTEASAGTVSNTATVNAPRGGVGAKAQVIG